MDYELTKLMLEIAEEERFFERKKEAACQVKEGEAKAGHLLHLFNAGLFAAAACLFLIVSFVCQNIALIVLGLIATCMGCYGEMVYSYIRKDRTMVFGFAFVAAIMAAAAVMLYVLK